MAEYPSKISHRSEYIRVFDDPNKVVFVDLPIPKYAKYIGRILGVNCSPYHGRMEQVNKNKVLYDFLNGNINIVVATSAFGAGVDKPAIRFIYHSNISDSLLDYAQESGRGRDKNLIEEADCCVFYNQDEINNLKTIRTANETFSSKEKEKSLNDMENYVKIMCRRRLKRVEGSYK